MSIKAQYVTLRLEFDPEYSSKPSKWDWDALLEENVMVIYAGDVFDPEEIERD
jgi:hypothetical protein